MNACIYMCLHIDLVWSRGVLWHMNTCELFNAKSYIYIYIYCWCSISISLKNVISVKYSLAHNKTQGKKNSHCAVKKVMHRKRVTSELHDSYFRSMTITQAIPKIAEVTRSDRQISEEIAEAWRRVHISVWEFEGNIRPTN